MGLFGICYMILILFSISMIFKTRATTVKFEDVDVEYVNREYLDENSFDISVNYINTTYNTLRCEAVVLKEFPEDSRISLKGYGYAFGKYLVPTGISINISTCDLKTKPVFIVPFITAVGGDLDKCGPDVGEYGNDSFVPVNLDMLPKIFPSNKYRIDAEVGNRDTKIVKVQFFISI